MIKNALLLAALIVTIALNFTLRRDPARPNYEYLPEMVHAVSSESFTANANFADGKTLQAPPEGAIPRGHPPLGYEATEEDALRAAVELLNPVDPDDSEAANRGRHVFQTFCLTCHGGGGKGDGPVAMRGFPPPPSLLVQKTVDMSDGQMFHVVTFGQKNMPGYAVQVPPDDRWKAIRYVRVLQETARIAAEKAIAATAAEAEAAAAAAEQQEETPTEEPQP
jgi:mono/diheme cytochrome c family protein